MVPSTQEKFRLVEKKKDILNLCRHVDHLLLHYQQERRFISLVILLFDQAAGLCAHPETWDQLLPEGALHLLQKLDLPGCSRTPLHGVEVEDARWLVQVDADGGAQGDVGDLHTLAFVPGVVAGAAPAEAPGLFIFSKATRTLAVPPPGALVRHADNHPP